MSAFAKAISNLFTVDQSRNILNSNQFKSFKSTCLLFRTVGLYFLKRGFESRNIIVYLQLEVRSKSSSIANIRRPLKYHKMLKNVVGLVTGGASGLGRATVERLVKEGARVTLAGIHFTFTYFVQSFT